MIKTCLLGLGRTGMVVADAILKAPQFELVSVISKPGGNKIGRPLSEYLPGAGELIIQDSQDLESEIETTKFTVAIDFTSPAAALQNTKTLAKHGVNVVIGTTGFNNIQLFEIEKITEQAKIGLVYAPNISVGINLLLSLVKTIARMIPHYDVDITESCHRHKKDAPSGTALRIAEAIYKAKGEPRSPSLRRDQKGLQLREKGEIGMHSIRAGGIVGVHQVLFAGESDEIEITHRAYSRTVYADGALKASTFINGRRGFYHMEDVLGTPEGSASGILDRIRIHCN